MNNLCFCPLFTPKELIDELPLSTEKSSFIASSREEIADILRGKSERLLLIVGPCSIHDIDAAMEYAHKLKELSGKFLVVMRAYFEKPRTKGDWKGFLYDPLLDGSNDMALGLREARRFLLKLAELKIPAATEFLDPIAANYLGDLISWGAIGSRTVKSQIHRQLASSLPMPVGFKNPLSGDLQVAANAIRVARESHTFMGIDLDGKASILRTAGNPNTHIVLRGGRTGTNYDEESIEQALSLCKDTRVLIDCSHDNSESSSQEEVFKSVIDKNHKGVAGLLLESNLFAGKQQITNQLDYGISITDSCISWQNTKNLIDWAEKTI